MTFSCIEKPPNTRTARPPTRLGCVTLPWLAERLSVRDSPNRKRRCGWPLCRPPPRSSPGCDGPKREDKSETEETVSVTVINPLYRANRAGARHLVHIRSGPPTMQRRRAARFREQSIRAVRPLVRSARLRSSPRWRPVRRLDRRSRRPDERRRVARLAGAPTDLGCRLCVSRSQRSRSPYTDRSPHTDAAHDTAHRVSALFWIRYRCWPVACSALHVFRRVRSMKRMWHAPCTLHATRAGSRGFLAVRPLSK